MPCRLLIAAILAGATAALSAQSTTPSFELNRDAYQLLGDLPIVQGDFNNDGKPDLVMGGGGSQGGDLLLRLGNGDGTFQPPIDLGAGAGGDMATGDLNGDGKLDLVVLTPNVYIYFGNGDGTFQAPVEYATTATGNSVTVGNFFGSGRLDIAVGDSSGNVELFQNEGGGKFVLANTAGTGTTSGVGRARAGDFDDDGITDIAALAGNNAYILWNDGHGNFHAKELGSYQVPGDLSVGDLNQDGMADVIVSYTCNPTLNSGPGKGPEYNNCAGFHVYYGQGNQTTFERTVVNYNGAMPGGQPFAADVNGDGLGDIVAESTPEGYGGAGLYVWLGHPDGSFDQAPQVYTASSYGVGALAEGDFNRDGMMDFAMTLPGDAALEIYINGGVRAPCQTSQINPTVTVCQPVDGTYSNSPVAVQANAYDKNTVTAMQEYIDGNLDYNEDVTSFTQPFTLGLGSHLFVTKAWDETGLSFRSDRTITVYNGTPGPACPAAAGTANICLPSGTTTSPVQIVANGYASWIPTSAQLYIDGDLVVNNQGCNSQGSCPGGTSYVQTTQSLSAGSHDLVFKLWDADGDVYQAEKTVTVQ